MVTGELVPFQPHRVVTWDWVGWWLTQGRDGAPGYMTATRYGVAEPLSLGELCARVPGGVRPVVVPLPHEADLVRAALFDAGSLAVTTLARALWRCVSVVGAAGLVAGRAGSWESQTLAAFARWGERVDSGRVHAGAADALRDQVMEWVTGRYRYVEVAATLAGLFGEVADRHVDEWLAGYAQEEGTEPNAREGLAQAWRSVADRRLWPDAYEGAMLGCTWYRYLMSTAAMFSPSWFEQWGSGR